MKAIVFDVDGVIIISADKKYQIIKNILQKYDLYDITGVSEILEMSLNRVVMLEKISEIITFDQQKVLNDINSEISELENNPIINENVVDFIRAHYKEYLFFTNTSLPRGSLDRILKALNLGHCFQKLFAGEDGFKKDNIYSIIEQYGLASEDILFIDDTLSHIDAVLETGVHLLHFSNLDIDIKSHL